MKIKYVLLLMFAIPTGKICVATMELGFKSQQVYVQPASREGANPIAPPDAAKLRPRARKFVGKICWRISSKKF
jgi:hypothetical protein